MTGKATAFRLSVRWRITVDKRPQKYSNRDPWAKVPFAEESPLVLGDYAVFACVIVTLVLVMWGLL